MPVGRFHHLLVVVLTVDCDLEQDFHVRQIATGQNASARDESDPALVPFTLLCDLYPSTTARVRVNASDLWKRIRQNQDERYHTMIGPSGFGPSAAGAKEDDQVVIDFKKTLAAPTGSLYEGIRSGSSILCQGENLPESVGFGNAGFQILHAAAAETTAYDG